MRRIILAACILALSAAGSAAEESSPLRELMTANDSRGWEGVGRIDIGGTGFCTGALIEPDIVLTAAHCLFDKDTKERVDIGGLRFLAGYRNGHASADIAVMRVSIHPEYDYQGPEDATSSAHDLALLELRQPIRKHSVAPFATGGRPRKGDEVGVVSYARERASRPSIQDTCFVLGRPEDTLILSCDVDFGASGSPVFVIENGEPRIVSVISAKAEVFGRQVSVSTPVEGSLTGLRAQLMDGFTTVGAESRMPTVNRMSTTNTAKGGGAKFVRP